MKHTFNLVYPNKEVSPIRLIVSAHGEKFRKSTGVSIRTKLWNQKARTPDKMCKDADVWAVLGPIHAKLVEKEVTAFKRADVLNAIKYALGEDITVSPEHLWDYFKEWSERECPSARFRKQAYERISDMMGTKDDWNDIDGDWLFRFERKANELKYSPNYRSTLLAKLKTVMNEAFNRGIHTNEDFRSFKTTYTPAETIALTQEEVDMLWRAELKGVQARARDCFVVGVYCAGRFQDYSQLSEDNVQDGKLRYVQRKTGQTVVLPLSPRIREVFERNGGRCPRITQQEVGREIKKICRSLGGSFLNVVEIRKKSGDKIVVEKKQRCDMISCHTARRTGATILYKSGVPIRVCRFLTMHSTDSMFLKYVKISKEEGADILAESDFFK